MGRLDWDRYLDGVFARVLRVCDVPVGSGGTPDPPINTYPDTMLFESPNMSTHMHNIAQVRLPTCCVPM